MISLPSSLRMIMVATWRKINNINIRIKKKGGRLSSLLLSLSLFFFFIKDGTVQFYAKSNTAKSNEAKAQHKLIDVILLYFWLLLNRGISSQLISLLYLKIIKQDLDGCY